MNTPLPAELIPRGAPKWYCVLVAAHWRALFAKEGDADVLDFKNACRHQIAFGNIKQFGGHLISKAGATPFFAMGGWIACDKKWSKAPAYATQWDIVDLP